MSYRNRVYRTGRCVMSFNKLINKLEQFSNMSQNLYHTGHHGKVYDTRKPVDRIVISGNWDDTEICRMLWTIRETQGTISYATLHGSIRGSTILVATCLKYEPLQYVNITLDIHMIDEWHRKPIRNMQCSSLRGFDISSFRILRTLYNITSSLHKFPDSLQSVTDYTKSSWVHKLPRNVHHLDITNEYLNDDDYRWLKNSNLVSLDINTLNGPNRRLIYNLPVSLRKLVVGCDNITYDITELKDFSLTHVTIRCTNNIPGELLFKSLNWKILKEFRINTANFKTLIPYLQKHTSCYGTKVTMA